ncbi:Reverse transcriptase domain-containing protein [Aphis craccivora]|uniref:Reverse transcriptase domain-containing protein n=1 Tax=Aphis craccivora TaxID=307492 RepID=A0A6G0VZE1_APHCR|nr:Reverse transcriptase domain-containing protein [Aphis craccivora]
MKRRYNIEDHAKSIMKVIETAADNAIPKARTGNIMAKQPWWNQKELDRNRRLGLHQTDRPTYIRARNLYLAEIRRAKMGTWRNFDEDINKNSWGKAFR